MEHLLHLLEDTVQDGCHNPRNPNLAPNSILMVLVDLDGSRNDAILEFSL